MIYKLIACLSQVESILAVVEVTHYLFLTAHHYHHHHHHHHHSQF